MKTQKLLIILLASGILLGSYSVVHAEDASYPGTLRPVSTSRPVIRNLVGSTSAGMRPKIENMTPEDLKKELPEKLQRQLAPQTPGKRLLTAAGILSSTADKMSTLSAKLKMRIDKAKTNGQTVTTLEALLSDMNAKIADAKAQAAAITQDVAGITSESTENKTILQASYKKLLTGIQDLQTAGQDARQIIQTLLTMSGGENTSASGSAGLLKKQVQPLMSR